MNYRELYNQMLSQLENETFEFKSGEIFEVEVRQDGELLKEWDLTKDIHANGMAMVNITEHGLNLTIVFMSDEAQAILKEDLFFQEMMLLYGPPNGSTVDITMTHLDEYGFSIQYLIFIFMAIIGVIGLIINVKGSAKKVVKFARCTHSVWFVLTLSLIHI